MDDIRFHVEAVLFASPSPLSESRLAELLELGVGVKVKENQITQTIENLNKGYETSGAAFKIQTWAGGYQFATIRDADDSIRPLFEEGGERRMSKALIETLAVIAYQQPVTKPEVDNIRGVDSTYGVRKLLDSSFITICGRGEGVGQPLLYGTTQRFLEEFGLGGLQDLPKIKEVEDILRDPEFSEQAETIHQTMLEVETEKNEAAEAENKIIENAEESGHSLESAEAANEEGVNTDENEPVVDQEVSDKIEQEENPEESKAE